MENMLNIAEQYGLATWKANCIPGYISKKVISLNWVGILSLFSALVWLYLEQCVQFWALCFELGFGPSEIPSNLKYFMIL